MEELKPCPFCGGKAYKSSCTSSVRCSNCGAVGSDYSISNEPADVRMKKAVNSWNTRHEQTCKPSKLYDHVFECSECVGMCTDGIPNFCPNCGAKVVDNG